MAVTRLTTIGNFPTATEAHAARLFLSAQGIEAIVVDEALVGNFWHYGNAVGGVKLQVDTAEASCARQCLAEQDRSTAGGRDAPTRPWFCDQCRQRVPAGFDVCWSCGTPRAAGAGEFEPNTEPAEAEESTRRRSSTGQPKVAQTICVACGADVPSGAPCPECGKRAEPNPYAPPLSPGEAVIRHPPGELRRQRFAGEAMAQRAWLSAIFGLVFLPPLLNIYSTGLLLILLTGRCRLSPRMFGRVAAAWAVNLTVLAILGLALRSMLR